MPSPARTTIRPEYYNQFFRVDPLALTTTIARAVYLFPKPHNQDPISYRTYIFAKINEACQRCISQPANQTRDNILQILDHLAHENTPSQASSPHRITTTATQTVDQSSASALPRQSVPSHPTDNKENIAPHPRLS